MKKLLKRDVTKILDPAQHSNLEWKRGTKFTLLFLYKTAEVEMKVKDMHSCCGSCDYHITKTAIKDALNPSSSAHFRS